jgi:ribulose kinase
MAFTLGIDYGTNSVRALLVDISNGRELATCVVDYPSGKHGIPLDSRPAHLVGGTLVTTFSRAAVDDIAQAPKL